MGAGCASMARTDHRVLWPQFGFRIEHRHPLGQLPGFQCYTSVAEADSHRQSRSNLSVCARASPLDLWGSSLHRLPRSAPAVVPQWNSMLMPELLTRQKLQQWQLVWQQVLGGYPFP